MVIWKWFPDDNWLCNQPMIMKLHTLTHRESRMRLIDFEVQRSRSWRMVIWKWFPDDNWLCNQPMIMKLHTLTHHESRMRPIDFEVKGQGHGAWLFENGFRTITDSVINLWSWNFIHLLTMSQGCTLLILRSKGQGHGAWLFENGFRTITDSVINLWSWNFIHLLPMSQGCALLILGSKGQRSRSWRMVIWKWSTEIMVADLNLLGSVGDLYCFSNTFSMLLYVAPICCPSCYFEFFTFFPFLKAQQSPYKWNQAGPFSCRICCFRPKIRLIIQGLPVYAYITL